MLVYQRVMLLKQCHKPSPSHHHFYRWYGYHSQTGGLWHCFNHITTILSFLGLPEMVPWTKKEAIELKKNLEDDSSECPARKKRIHYHHPSMIMYPFFKKIWYMYKYMLKFHINHPSSISDHPYKICLPGLVNVNKKRSGKIHKNAMKMGIHPL